MKIDMDSIWKFSLASASAHRDEANSGKWYRSKGYVSKEQMRRNAAQTAFKVLYVLLVIKIISELWHKYADKYGKWHATFLTASSCVCVFTGLLLIIMLFCGELDLQSFWNCILPFLYTGLYVGCQEFFLSRFIQKWQSKVWVQILIGLVNWSFAFIFCYVLFRL